MKHFGDITQIRGNEVPIVDIVTGGSPCQDLSVAGKRAGLDGARSGLFMEQIRIIKEMREHDRATKGATYNLRCVRPRYMVWENVPGAFSSNKGEDFRCVLEETARIADETAVIPEPMGGGKWTPAGCVMGTGWSIAWRVHDAQFWGVPQRRKRIALVADFGGSSAPKILFERKSVSGNLEQSRETGQGAATIIEGNTGETGTISFQERAGKSGGARESLYRENEQEHCQRLTTNTYCLEGNGSRESHKGDGYKESDVMYTLNTVEQHAICMGTAYDGSQVSPTITANNVAGQQKMPDKDNFNAVISYGVDCYNHKITGDVAASLNATSCDSPSHSGPSVITYGVDCYNQTQAEEVTQPLRSINADTDHIPCVYGIDRASFNQGKNAQYDFAVDEDLAQTLVSRGPGGY